MGSRGPMALPTDPLHALGPSLFLSILSHLPLQPLINASLVHPTWHALISSHPTTLFRPLAHRLGIERHHLHSLEAAEQTTSFSISSAGSADPDEAPGWEIEEPDLDLDVDLEAEEPGARVDWRGVVKAWIKLQRNWKWGRAKGSWLTPGRNTVWRMKVDEEEKTLLTTSRLDGILVSDLETSEPLFEYVDVAPYAHLEFIKGFAIFNIGHDHRLEVHLTPSAVRRLPPHLQSLPSSRRSLTYDRGYSFTTQAEYTTPTSPSSASDTPPRGHLTYFRTIRPPTNCLAFRARVDHEDVEEDARVVLGTAGEEAVYIWDLEDKGKVETYPIPESQRERPNYIEFDDDFVFLCGATQLHVISRRSKNRIASFPSDHPTNRDLGDAVYVVHPQLAFIPERRAFANASLIGRASVEGRWREDRRFSDLVEEAMQELAPNREFNACHYTSSDLFCTTASGIVHVLRDYREVLAIEDAQKRDETILASLLTIVVKDPVQQLATYGDHVAVTTSENVILLETSSLPSPPYNFPFSPSAAPSDMWSRSKLVLTSLRQVHPRGLQQASCLQMDRENVYLVYWALGEMDAGGVEDEEIGVTSVPPPEATSDFGICVKKWDFGLRR
ncbi:hypothetical protein IAR55_002485 [Kwoniella newhampshirensis]|uniref:F-box domain-containing protein n=1 Tax=Kwoniella newhampshirensis TaxID=1651941 RepID=A0AAW0Z184_9TREE